MLSRLTIRPGVAFLVLCLAAGPAARPVAAEDVVGAVKGLALAALIRNQADNADKLLDAVTLRHGAAARDATKVVPGYSVGRKAYVGAYQVTGPQAQLDKVHAVFEVTGQVDGGKGRFAHLFPSVTANPLDMKRVDGISMVAAVDSPLWGSVGTFPIGGSEQSRLLRATAAIAAAKLAGPAIDTFLNKLNGHPAGIPTRVVPILTVGEKAYVGLAQVMGRGAGGVDAVLQLEENLGSQLKARILVPVDASLGLRRVPEAGVSTIVDMVLEAGSKSSKEVEDARKPVVVAAPPPPGPPATGPVVVVSGLEDVCSGLPPGLARKCHAEAQECVEKWNHCDSNRRDCEKKYSKCASRFAEEWGETEWEGYGPPPWANPSWRRGRDKGRGKGHGRGKGRGKGRGHDDD